MITHTRTILSYRGQDKKFCELLLLFYREGGRQLIFNGLFLNISPQLLAGGHR